MKRSYTKSITFEQEKKPICKKYKKTLDDLFTDLHISENKYICLVSGCNNVAKYNYIAEQDGNKILYPCSYCYEHKKEGMVNLDNYDKCEHKGCYFEGKIIDPTSSQIRCKKHTPFAQKITKRG